MKGKDIRLARLTGIVGSAFALGLYLFPAVGSSSSMQTTEISDVATGHSRIAKAAKVERAPEVDGEILSDPAWSMAEPIDGFWQTTPDEGKPSTQQTEVRIVYTSDTIYVGVVCYDEDPERIIISDSRRDASLNETDSFQLIFDTYDDHQNGFVFGTNPAGIEYDAQVNNEGEGGRFGGRQQRGTAAGFNINWDGSWEVRAKITQIGWCAEFAIPFRTLRYPRKKEQIWGLNFQRNIRRRNESAYWTRLPRQYNIQKLSEAGLLAGLEIPNRINLKLMPHLLGQASRNFVDNLDTDWDNDFGVDARYSITPGLTLVLTYNTHFALVEV
ncbi:MAG: carbohydrate binding family 9 domain-containing protein, partial [Planctomycetota bacterium]